MRQERWIAPYMKMYSGRLALYLILGIATLLTASMLMFTSGFLISKSATQPYNILLVYVPIVGVRAFGISRAVVHYVERLVGHDTVLRILSRMRGRLYRVLEPQALFIRSRYRTGDMLGALSDDIEQLQNVYIRTVFPSLIALVLYAVVVVAIGVFDPSFAVLMGLYILVLVAVLPYVSLKLTHKLNVEMKQERNGLYQKLTDAVMGIGDWVISGRSGDFLERYEQDEALVMRLDRSLRSWARWRTLIGQTVIGLAVVSMIYWSASEVAAGQLNPVMIAAFVLVVFPLADAFIPVAEAVQRVPEYKQSLERLNRISGASEVTGELADGEVMQRESATGTITSGTLISGTITLGTVTQSAPSTATDAISKVHIQLHDVSFAYPSDETNSVEQVTLDIPQGKRVMIIGRSGAGKSTLLKLIMGTLVPTQGSVLMNEASTGQFTHHLSKVISVLNQSPHLFDTTIANNIMLGREHATREDVTRAAERAQLGELMASLPQGLDTPMRETGGRFSGGERQRVALARVLLQDTPVLILDEPTVGLDPRTERELLSTIFRTTKQKTLIWVTHHLVGAEYMDEIIFMEHGRILMRGTHTELLANEPRYQHLYELDQP